MSHQTSFPNWRGRGKLSFEFEPGSKHEYSGEGFEYLRRAIERKTGQSFSELMDQHVIKNAGMKDTYFGWDETLGDRFAVNHDHMGKPINNNKSLKRKKANAAANTFTTINDYGRFSEWVLARADLSASLFEEMQKNQAQHPNPTESYGLSWKLTQVGNETVISHTGRESGLFIQVVLWPQSRQGIIVFTNGTNGELVTRKIVAEAIEPGRAFRRHESLDTWKWFSGLTNDELAETMHQIVKTPSFMDTLLNAIQSSLRATSNISEAERSEARQQFDQLIRIMVSRGLDPTTTAAIRQIVMDVHHESPSKEKRFDDEQFRSLVRATRSAANPTEIVLERKILKTYEGEYRIEEGKWTGLTIAVQVEDQSLAIRVSGGDSVPAIPISKSLFSIPTDHLHLEFNNGNTDTITVYAVNNQTLIAHLIDPEKQ